MSCQILKIIDNINNIFPQIYFTISTYIYEYIKKQLPYLGLLSRQQTIIILIELVSETASTSNRIY